MSSRSEISGEILFNEVQFFRVKWLWVLLIAVILVSIILPVIFALVSGQKLREAILSLLITVPIEVLVLYIFYVVRLETIVTRDGVYYRWLPFFRKYNFIARNDIETAIVGKGPVLSYGIHFVLGYGWVHNTGPGEGIQFNLIGGKRIFIGTHQCNAFESATDKMIKGKI